MGTCDGPRSISIALRSADSWELAELGRSASTSVPPGCGTRAISASGPSGCATWWIDNHVTAASKLASANGRAVALPWRARANTSGVGSRATIARARRQGRSDDAGPPVTSRSSGGNGRHRGDEAAEQVAARHRGGGLELAGLAGELLLHAMQMVHDAFACFGNSECARDAAPGTRRLGCKRYQQF